MGLFLLLSHYKRNNVFVVVFIVAFVAFSTFFASTTAAPIEIDQTQFEGGHHKINEEHYGGSDDESENVVPTSPTISYKCQLQRDAKAYHLSAPGMSADLVECENEMTNSKIDSEHPKPEEDFNRIMDDIENLGRIINRLLNPKSLKASKPKNKNSSSNKPISKATGKKQTTKPKGKASKQALTTTTTTTTTMTTPEPFLYDGVDTDADAELPMTVTGSGDESIFSDINLQHLQDQDQQQITSSDQDQDQDQAEQDEQIIDVNARQQKHFSHIIGI